MNLNSENLDQPLAESEGMAAAALINSVGSLMDRLVATDGSEQLEIAARMGVSPSRISQILNGDGNVRISTLARLAEACHADLSFTANFPDTKDSVTVPRSGKRAGRRPHVVSRSGEVADLGDSLSAAAMINAIGSLMDQVVEKSGVARKDIAEAMGVTPGRVTQILDGDGNVYISTLARVMFASRATLKLEATHRESGAVLVAPRPVRRRMARSESAEGAKVLQFPNRRVVKQAESAGSAEERPSARARMSELAPVRELVKRGILPPGSGDESGQEILCDLLEIRSIWEHPRFEAAARRHNLGEDFSPSQIMWLALARRAARRVEVDDFDREGLESLASRLSKQLTTPEAFSSLPEWFSAVGVRLVWVEPFSGSKISGLAFPLDRDSRQPVIALSGRGERLDKVLFTLLHEVAHICLGHLDDGVGVLDDEADKGSDPREDAADELAKQWAIAEPWSPPTTVTKAWIDSEAKRRGVHPIVLVGRLQNDSALAWNHRLSKNPPKVKEQLYGWHQGIQTGRFTSK